MKKNKILYLILLIVSFIYLSYGCTWKKGKCTENGIIKQNLQDSIIILEKIFWQQIMLSYEGKMLDNIEGLLTSNTDVVNSRPLLIYRFSPNMCNSCIQEDLLLLLKYIKKIGRDRILILPDFEDTRDDRIRMQSVLADFNYINVSKEIIPFPVDKDSVSWRYMAIFDANNQVRHVFFPCLDYSKMTESYIEKLLIGSIEQVNQLK